MGGYGSTRWRWHDKKQIVEDCLSFSVGSLRKALEAVNEPDHPVECYCKHSIHWTDGSAIGYTLKRFISGKRALILDYKRNSHPIQTEILFETTTLPGGGLRYWFSCPQCKQRAYKLYLPPGASTFACRKCHDLSYRSAQEAHKFDRSSSEFMQLLGQLDKLINQKTVKYLR